MRDVLEVRLTETHEGGGGVKIGIIGVGNIGSIILERLLISGKFDPDDITIHNRTRSKAERYAGRGVNIAESNAQLCENSDLIFLCVKPQDADEMLSQMGGVDMTDKIVISTMVGVKISKIKEKTGARKIVRIMPNVPAMIGKGITPAAFSDDFSADEIERVVDVLKVLGKVVKIREKHLPAVTALSGSGPAFVFVVVEALIDAGLRSGLSYDISRELVLETLKGSAELLQVKGNHPGEFRHMVTSPAGTTIEGIFSLEREGIRGVLMKAIFDTYKRAQEFENFNT